MWRRIASTEDACQAIAALADSQQGQQELLDADARQLSTDMNRKNLKTVYATELADYCLSYAYA